MTGSPPPMRGKVRPVHLFRHGIGITPAYAGKSRSVRRSGILTQDHPRLCGEKLTVTVSHASESGSPPPMRGKGTLPVSVRSARRITPAYAGKSDTKHTVLEHRKDHPRLCGEKAIVTSVPCSVLGSPPPMRGKAFLSGSLRTPTRITPAYAGKRQAKVRCIS